MFKYILLFSLLLLPSCTLNPFATPSNLDTVEVVKYTPYTKIHQIYIPREKLHKFKNNLFLKYFYNKKKKKLYILTQNAKYYFLYNITKPNTKKITISKKKYPYRKLVKKLRTAHILHIRNVTPLAYEVKIHYRKLSNIKTLYLKITNYQKLQRAYKKALSKYDTKYINHLRYKLPKSYIYADYLKSKKNAQTDKQKKSLSFIAKKLGFLQEEKKSNTTPEKSNEIAKKELPTKLVLHKTDTEENTIEKNTIEKNTIEETMAEENTIEENTIEETMAEETTTVPIIQNQNIAITKITAQDTPYKKKPYQYFLLSSNIKEISSYLQEAKRTKSLSYIQYKKLLARKIFLKEAYLLKHANIAELIRAYKINQKPTFKKRIMELMKEKQEESSPI